MPPLAAQQNTRLPPKPETWSYNVAFVRCIKTGSNTHTATLTKLPQNPSIDATTQNTIQGIKSSSILVFGSLALLLLPSSPLFAPSSAPELFAPALDAAPKKSSQCIIRSKSPSTEYRCFMSASSPAISPLAIERQTSKGVLIRVVKPSAKPSSGSTSTRLPFCPRVMR